MHKLMPIVPTISPKPSRMQPPPSPIRPDATELPIAPMNIMNARTPAMASAAAAAVTAKPASDTASENAKITALATVIIGNHIGNVMISKISLAIFINRAVRFFGASRNLASIIAETYIAGKRRIQA